MGGRGCPPGGRSRRGVTPKQRLQGGGTPDSARRRHSESSTQGPPGGRGPTGREHVGWGRVAIKERRRPGSERSRRRGTRQARRRSVLLQGGGCGPSPARLPSQLRETCPPGGISTGLGQRTEDGDAQGQAARDECLEHGVTAGSSPPRAGRTQTAAGCPEGAPPGTCHEPARSGEVDTWHGESGAPGSQSRGI